MPAVPNPEPAIQDIYVFNWKNLGTLSSYGMIEVGEPGFNGEGCDSLIIDHAKIALPKIATSRSGLTFLGFNATTVEEIWAYINNPESATPMMLTNSATITGKEFWNRVKKWLDDRILYIKQNLFHPDTSSRELLDHLGLRDEVQIQYHQLNATPIFGGLQKFCLVQVIESDVLAWAKKVITRNWNAMVTVEFCIFRGGKEINQLGFADVVKELTQRPIDSEMAYVSDPTFRLLADELKLKAWFFD